MKKYIFCLASVAALLVTSCRKIEMDGETVVIEVPGNGGGGSTSRTVTLSGRITKDTTLRKIDENILKGLVYITNGVTLTVEAGAIVKGSFSGADVAALIITRGGKIMQWVQKQILLYLLHHLLAHAQAIGVESSC